MSDKKSNAQFQAVALSYDAKNDAAPKVVAKGKGLVATKIIDKAKEHHVPIQEDPSLVGLLSEIKINETIPEQLYSAVAEVFAFIYQVDRTYAKK